MDVIRHFRDFIESAPDELTAYAAFLSAPDGSPLVGVIPCYCGGIGEGQRVVEPLRKFGNPIVDTIQPMPFPTMQSLLAPAFPDGNHNYWKSALQRELTDDAITAIVEHANRMMSPLSFVVLEYYGGAAGRIPKDATAFPHRDLPWDILFIAQWTDSSETTLHRDWARAGEEAFDRPLPTRTSFQRLTSNRNRNVDPRTRDPARPRFVRRGMFATGQRAIAPRSFPAAQAKP